MDNFHLSCLLCNIIFIKDLTKEQSGWGDESIFLYIQASHAYVYFARQNTTIWFKYSSAKHHEIIKKKIAKFVDVDPPQCPQPNY